MAPELRKRKSVPDTQKSNSVSAKAGKGSAKGKRKAAEDASPVSIKKQKPAKKAAPTEKPTPKATKNAAKKEKVEEDADTLRVDDSDSDGEDNDNLKALAGDVDSEDEAPVDKALSYKAGQDVGKIPDVSKQLAKAAKEPKGEPGVVYIGRIPHGFYEHEMRQYLSQFGHVSRVRLSRNKKTGASKHFAFVEFKDASTADIVAKTMDNYILFGHILKCKTIPKEQVHEDMFKGANKRFKKVPWNKMAGLKLDKPQSESAWKSRVNREKNKRARQAEKLKSMGYDFEAPDLRDVPPPAPSAEKDAEETKAIEAAPVVEAENDAKAEAQIASETKEAESIPAPKKATRAAKSGKGKKAKA